MHTLQRTCVDKIMYTDGRTDRPVTPSPPPNFFCRGIKTNIYIYIIYVSIIKIQYLCCGVCAVGWSVRRSMQKVASQIFFNCKSRMDKLTIFFSFGSNMPQGSTVWFLKILVLIKKMFSIQHCNCTQTKSDVVSSKVIDSGDT